MLERHRDPALRRGKAGYVLAGDRQRATILLHEPGDRSQQRRLAATRWAQQNADLTFGDVQIDVGEHGHGTEALGKVLYGDEAHAVRLRTDKGDRRGQPHAGEIHGDDHGGHLADFLALAEQVDGQGLELAADQHVGEHELGEGEREHHRQPDHQARCQARQQDFARHHQVAGADQVPGIQQLVDVERAQIVLQRQIQQRKRQGADSRAAGSMACRSAPPGRSHTSPASRRRAPTWGSAYGRMTSRSIQRSSTGR